MAHPFAHARDHKVQHARVKGHLKGYASGGGVHADEAEDRKMVKKMVKRKALRMDGGAVRARADRPARAAGGRVKRGGKHHTSVNVNVMPQASHSPLAAAGAPILPPARPAPPPPMAGVAPPMLPPGGMPPGIGAGMPPGMPPMRAKGGRIKPGPGWTESVKNMTPVQHTPGKDDTKDIGRGKPITYKTGGAVMSAAKGQMGPKMDAGAGGGEGRLEKTARAKRSYAKA